MTKEELISRIQDIEWDDFEVKSAQDKLPNDVWETVSAFSNTSGGWIVFGVKQNGKNFEIQGVSNGEKTESDFLNTIRNGQKFNTKLTAIGKRYEIGGKRVLAFYVPSSLFKPIYFGTTANTFIRSGSGDRHATDMEIMAMMRDQSFGSRSEQAVEGTSIEDLNQMSLETYRNHIARFNPSFPYLTLPLPHFCEKVGICKVNGELTWGGLLMFGGRDAVTSHLSNFWIDFLEVPGRSYSEAGVRYTYRMQEQDNIWESYQIIIQRLRNYCDNPYIALSNGVGPEDESQLYALREGLVNLCAHADYFSPMHPTIRVYTDRIEFQNPGRFMFPLEELRTQIHSMPRNPNLIKFFRYAKLGENAGYGIDKMLTWEKMTGKTVDFQTDLVCSTITYWFSDQVSDQPGVQVSGQAGVQVSGQVGQSVDNQKEQAGGQVSGQAGGQASDQPGDHVQKLLNAIRDNVYTLFDVQRRLNIASRSFVREKMIVPAIEQGYVLRAYPDKPRHPQQRYYLSEKGLKQVK